MKTLSIVAITAFAFLGLANFASAQGVVLQVSSTSFQNNQILPIRSVFDRPRTNEQNEIVNECSPDGIQGTNLSPQLSWTNAPGNTAFFVVTAVDKTAGVTHWGMYNIPKATTVLEEGAGAVGSRSIPFNPSAPVKQVVNIFDNQRYDGPCPPEKDPRGDPHVYVFTVYALDSAIDLPSSADDELLLSLLAQLGADKHILASGSITGCWSSTPPPDTPSSCP
jgi:Raf kinase inhibitor-like YbhB/YbcL family protein